MSDKGKGNTAELRPSNRFNYNYIGLLICCIPVYIHKCNQFISFIMS